MHNNDAFSGATMAMLEVIKLMPSDIEKVVLFPSNEGTASDRCINQNIHVEYAKYWCETFSSEKNIIKSIFKSLRYISRKIVMWTEEERMKKIVKDVDIIYSNTVCIKFGLKLAQRYNKKHIWHIREFGDLDHGLKFPSGKKHYMKSGNNESNYFVLISNSIKKHYDNFIENKKHSFLIYDDLDSKYLNPKKHIKNDKLVNMLIAGDIQPGKGQLEAVKALGELNDDIYHLYIAGPVSDMNYNLEITEYIEKNPFLKNNIHFLGRVKNMNKLRENMDIGLVCSNCEAFGRVTVEGMLSQLAMIGKNSGGTAELIENNNTGLLYNGSVTDLANAILILKNEEKRKYLANNGFVYAKNIFINGRCAKQITNLIFNVVDGSVK